MIEEFSPDPHLELLHAAREVIDSMLDWSGAPSVIQRSIARLERAVLVVEDASARAEIAKERDQP